MSEPEKEEDREKIPVPVRKHEQKVEQEIPEKVLKPRSNGNYHEGGAHTKGGVEK